jgi:Na+/melibiose symporter-like transporter
MSGVDAFQLLIGIFCLIAVAMMVLPVIFINEEKLCIRHESAPGNPLQQMMEVLKNHNFRRYTIVEMLYWFSSQFLQVGVPYYVTTLMGMDEGFTTLVIIIAAGFAFVCYAPITKFTEKYGKKRVMMFGYLLLIANFLFVSLLGIITLPVWLIVVLMVVLNSIPMAIFGILPMALVADIATEEGRKTGVFRAATYFGVKSFAMKIGVSLTNLLFPTLLLLGNSSDNNLGVRLTAIAGLITGLSSALMMRKVIDPEVE